MNPHHRRGGRFSYGLPEGRSFSCARTGSLFLSFDVLKERSFSSCGKSHSRERFVSGHDFSRAVRAIVSVISRRLQSPRELRQELSLRKKVCRGDVLKGHGFSRAAHVLYCCHPERASAREGSAFEDPT